MKVTGERYQARAVITYPDGMVPTDRRFWGELKMTIGDSAPTPEEVAPVVDAVAELAMRYTEEGLGLRVSDPLIHHQERHTRRIIGIPLSTWHTVEVSALPVPQIS